MEIASKVDSIDCLNQNIILIIRGLGVFGRNEIVGQKYFDQAGEKLFVTSIFATLQGEGPYRGEPAVFVRLAK